MVFEDEEEGFLGAGRGLDEQQMVKLQRCGWSRMGKHVTLAVGSCLVTTLLPLPPHSSQVSEVTIHHCFCSPDPCGTPLPLPGLQSLGSSGPLGAVGISVRTEQFSVKTADH